MRKWAPSGAVLGLVLGGVVPPLVAVLLVPFRDETVSANVAMALMVGVVGAAALGGRRAGAVATLAAAASYDFFHTRPYHSLRVASRADVEMTVLLLLAGLIVGTVASRARSDRASAEAGRREMRRIRRLADQVVTGGDVADVIMAAEAELTALLALEGCRFEAPPYREPMLRLERGGCPADPGPRRGTRTGGVELPAGGAELQVLSRGQPVGRFVLLPGPRGGLSLEQRVVAVALADQVGAVLGAHPPGQDRRHRSYG